MKEFNLEYDKVIQDYYDFCHSKYEVKDVKVPYIHILKEDVIDYRTNFICENNLIFEIKSVYRNEDFKNIFNLISNLENSSVKVLTKIDLNSLCDIKKYGKWIKNKSLALVKDEFTNFEKFIDFIRKIVDHFEKDKLIDAFNTLKIGKSMYMPFSEKVGLMLINTNKYNEYVISHEMIHFIQDVTGQAILNSEIKVDERNNIRFTPIEKLAKLEQLNSFGIIKNEYVKYVISEYELIPYINSICYLFERNGLKDKEPLEVINSLIKFKNNLGNNGTVRDIRENILDKICFRDISRPELLVLIICLVYDQHLTLLKRTVGNYFKNMKKEG